MIIGSGISLPRYLVTNSPVHGGVNGFAMPYNLPAFAAFLIICYMVLTDAYRLPFVRIKPVARGPGGMPWHGC